MIATTAAADPPTSLEGTARRLLGFSYASAFRTAMVRLQAGHNVHTLTAEMIADHPQRIATILGVPADSPARGDLERAISNLIEDAVWAAVRNPAPSA